MCVSLYGDWYLLMVLHRFVWGVYDVVSVVFFCEGAPPALLLGEVAGAAALGPFPSDILKSEFSV